MIEKYEVVIIIMMKTDTQDFLNSCFVDFQIRHLSAPVPQMITNSLRGLVLNLINLNCLKLIENDDLVVSVYVWVVEQDIYETK
jgi:hypothetical protein